MGIITEMERMTEGLRFRFRLRLILLLLRHGEAGRGWHQLSFGLLRPGGCLGGENFLPLRLPVLAWSCDHLLST